MYSGQFVIGGNELWVAATLLSLFLSNSVPRNGQEAYIKYPCLWSGLDDFIEQLLCI